MSQIITKLQNGEYANNEEILYALSLEAKKRKISYGTLISNTSEFERKKIVQKYHTKNLENGIIE